MFPGQAAMPAEASPEWWHMTSATALSAISRLIVLIGIGIMPLFYKKLVSSSSKRQERTGFSVNYHFLRSCNYKCKFCFHTAKTSDVLPVDNAKKGLRRLVAVGMEKVNFAGGEPFLEADMLGDMVQFCKEELGLCVTVVSNGSKIKDEWMDKYAPYLDMLTVSIDSFDDETNKRIGRASRSSGTAQQTQLVKNIAELCHKHKVNFRINTVVCAYNKDEDMVDSILELGPYRWKVFQVLPLEGENCGDGALRDVVPYLITDEEYQVFVGRHKHRVEKGKVVMVPENNEIMKDSYIMLDEMMYFLDCRDGGKSRLGDKTVLDGSLNDLRQLLKDLGHDQAAFVKRDGYYYQTSKAAMSADSCGASGSEPAELF